MVAIGANKAQTESAERKLGDIPIIPAPLEKRLSNLENSTRRNEEVLHQLQENPVMQLKLPESPEQSSVEKVQMPDWLKLLVNVANGVSAGTSGLAALTSATTGNKTIVNSVEKLAEYCNKGSFGLNSLFNAVSGFFDKNIFNMVGYAGEFLITTCLPEKVMGLARGLSFPTYQMRNILSSVEAFRNPKSFSDEFSMIKSRAGKAIKMMLSPSTYSWNKAEMLLGAWGGILSALGVAGWAVTGSTKVGGVVKGIGEAMIDGYQIAPVHREAGRVFYSSSGWAFIVGSICEIIGRLKNDDPIFRNLYFMGSSIGRLLLTKSNTNKESEYTVKRAQPAFALAS